MLKRILSVIMLCALVIGANAQSDVVYNIGAIANAGSGDFAPYFISSNNHGVLYQPYSVLTNLGLNKATDYTKRFSLGFGAEVYGGYAESMKYGLYDYKQDRVRMRKVSSSSLWIQQLYAEAKYRSVFLTLGQKEGGSKILNDKLSSGDMTYSANSRPMPGVRAGFWAPQDIPFTNGWVQISGELAYYKQTDSSWLENHYNYFNEFITTDLWYNYKYCYFHTKPSQPFSLTIGMQAASQFGGVYEQYIKGKLFKTVDMSPDLSTFVRMLIPGSGGTNAGDQSYYEGNHIGSWDVMGRYRMNDGTILKAYYQSPWEDGSGIGKMNGFDGLYGFEYKSADENAAVTGLVVEYLDLMNQGGPIHWEPADLVNPAVTGNATGGDNYYNNYTYCGYQYYGMTVGSPVLRSPFYNTDGFLPLTDTRLRSIHLAFEGNLKRNVTYRAKFGATKSWGTVFVPISKPRKNTSAMIECEYKIESVKGMKIKGQVAMDKGTLYGDNFGALLTVSYSGLLK